MGVRLNPLSGNFDFTGSGGGGASYIDGEVATYNDLPLDGTAALNSAWLVRTASGVWPVSRKQAGIYIRTATGGSSRDADYTYAGTMPDVFSDAQFLIYDDGNTTRTMQVEITDNETLTFKVTGTDSVVRSVAFPLSAILIAALMFASSALAQNIGLVTDTNGIIRSSRTNVLTWTNPIWASNGLRIGTNILATNGGIWRDTNVLRFRDSTNGTRTLLNSEDNLANLASPAAARTNLGINVASNLPAPFSGAAANGALLTADGAGSSSFVASRIVTKFTTNDQTKTNWAFNANTQSTNNDTQMGSWSLDANSFYRVEYAIAWVATTNSGFAHALGFTTNLSEFTHRTGVGQAANTTVTAINAGTNATVIALANVSAAATGGRFAVAGFVYVLTSSNANTMNYRWYPINNSADATTLIQSSMLSVTKMSP